MICPSLSCPSAGSQAGKECARNGGKESSAWGEMAEKSVGNTWPRGPRGYHISNIIKGRIFYWCLLRFVIIHAVVCYVYIYQSPDHVFLG
jgi:hypothetical protein